MRRKFDEQGRARFADPRRDRKLVAAAVEAPVRRCLRRPSRGAVTGCCAGSRRSPLRRGLEAGPRRARRFPEPAGDFQSRRRRRCTDGRRHAAESAAGSRRGRRSHLSHDGICRAARADAPPAGAISAGQPAREAVGAEISVAGKRAFGRDHGPRHARLERGRRAAASRLSRLGLEPECKADRWHHLLSRRGTARCVSAGNRYPGLPAAADAGYAPHSQSRIVHKTPPQRPARRAGADQCRPRRLAERSRHPGMPRRRHTWCGVAGRFLAGAAACGQPVLDPSESGADAAQRRRHRSR